MSTDYIRPSDSGRHWRQAAARALSIWREAPTLLVLGQPARAGRRVSWFRCATSRSCEVLDRLPDGRVFIGAMTTHAELAANPEIQGRLHGAGRGLSARSDPLAVRTAATWGATCCTAAPSADTASALLPLRGRSRAARSRRHPGRPAAGFLHRTWADRLAVRESSCAGSSITPCARRRVGLGLSQDQPAARPWTSRLSAPRRWWGWRTGSAARLVIALGSRRAHAGRRGWPRSGSRQGTRRRPAGRLGRPGRRHRVPHHGHPSLGGLSSHDGRRPRSRRDGRGLADVPSRGDERGPDR